MLEILTGRKPFERSRSEQSLFRWETPQLHDIDALDDVVDSSLKGPYPPKSLLRFADVVALCVQALVRLVQRANVSKRNLGEDRRSEDPDVQDDITNNKSSYLLPTSSNSSSPVVLPSSITSPASSSFSSRDAVVDEGLKVSLAPSSENKQKCDLFKGTWVWDEENAPYYTNATCSAIHEQQNCIKYEKPNLDFTKWRWKPNECKLPIFDPVEFLELLRGKPLAFVGDSVGRNQFASLPSGSTLNIYLDEFDDEWTSQTENHDYVIICWTLVLPPGRSSMSGKLVGCLYSDDDNVKHFDPTYGYGIAFATSFRAVNSLENSKGIAFLRTFSVSPSHFEGGSWNEGGNCLKTKPFLSNETQLHDQDLKMYTTQLEEFKVAEREGLKKNSGVVNNFRLLDTTQMLWSRPDGHPSSYWQKKEEVGKYNDCVHWCLPGPIDTLNDILLEMLKIETN
ncbi:hypothetical protein C5167_050199 [Papaver somniferum]|uniref:Uncharacterized protein n=1 Tax=Papaver somniferum TaxID=3469 RepID=A0A4Y7KRH3_PAPSO|nr:hypothetical protein C5167_050199 [Papaver somniferum]